MFKSSYKKTHFDSLTPPVWDCETVKTNKVTSDWLSSDGGMKTEKMREGCSCSLPHTCCSSHTAAIIHPPPSPRSHDLCLCDLTSWSPDRFESVWTSFLFHKLQPVNIMRQIRFQIQTWYLLLWAHDYIIYSQWNWRVRDNLYCESRVSSHTLKCRNDFLCFYLRFTFFLWMFMRQKWTPHIDSLCCFIAFLCTSPSCHSVCRLTPDSFFFVLKMFVDNFQTAKEALSAATAQAAEKAVSSVRDFAQKSFRLSMDIKLKAPLIIIPQSSTSQNAVVVDLGLIKVENSFSLLPVEGFSLPVVVEKMDVKLTQLKLSRWVNQTHTHTFLKTHQRELTSEVTFDLWPMTAGCCS